MIALTRHTIKKNDDTNVMIDDDLILATCVDETQSLKGEKVWVLDSATFIHICNDKHCSKELDENENFSDIMVSNKEIVQVRYNGSVHL